MLINQLLKLNRKCSQVKQCKINISEQLFLTFKRKYRLSTRYKPVPPIKFDHFFSKKNHIFNVFDLICYQFSSINHRFFCDWGL
ncbi:hypothetical protein BpHYR1_004540 [Brachionus plicatilis]|uniref:Uncharacterized protein n=1 Tax=Brachionus plicatilis TaxID=10195 RepID=A0A3M7PWY3_BRAPC|nr:hypothetical protein BpHYR1_004540 [Brachionus plicatilis]